MRQLGQRLHRGDDVDDLEARLARGEDALLAGDHHHRHRAHVGEGGGGGEVERAGAERGDAHARLAREPAVGRGHEAGRLLVTCDHQLDLRMAQRLDDVEVLLARDAEDAFDAFVLECRDEQVRSLGGHRLGLHVNRLDVDELADAEVRALPTVA